MRYAKLLRSGKNVTERIEQKVSKSNTAFGNNVKRERPGRIEMYTKEFNGKRTRNRDRIE